MPAFPAHAEDIARGLAAQHGFPPKNEARPPIDTDLAAIGQELALSHDMFRCNSCHSVGADAPVVAGQLADAEHQLGEASLRTLAAADTETINFAHIPDRLRRSYFDRFTLDPQRILLGTQMPQYALDYEAPPRTDPPHQPGKRKSSIPHILDGDMGRQFDAIWHFMRSLLASSDSGSGFNTDE